MKCFLDWQHWRNVFLTPADLCIIKNFNPFGVNRKKGFFRFRKSTNDEKVLLHCLYDKMLDTPNELYFPKGIE